MATRDKIIAYAQKHDSFTTRDLVKVLEISRQTVSEQVSRLVNAGRLHKSGSTRAARYALGSKGNKVSRLTFPELLLNKKLRGLEEDRVLSEVQMRMGLKSRLSDNSQRIFSYAFTEMLNNAIEHSRSTLCAIRVKLFYKTISFTIRDYGIGVYSNVKHRFRLASEFDALEHVFKGRQTTDPSRHSGEGIFFTSRIGDRFVLRSHRLEATFDNVKNDLFVKDVRFLKGTEVTFEMKKKTKRTLSDLFSKYTNQDLEFDKNVVRVKLSETDQGLSRSQARRLLYGLDKFRRITFDFIGIKEIGQGFADEIFRVFANKYPQVDLTFANATPAVAFMITRAIRAR